MNESESIEAGDTLLIPAPAPVVAVRAASHGRPFGKGRYSIARVQLGRSTFVHRATHVAASRRVPPQLLHSARGNPHGGSSALALKFSGLNQAI